MDRRDFLKATAGGVGLALSQPLESTANAATEKKPNILFILVDEMRFPSVFPAGVATPNQFLAKFMPNTHSLWRQGVKFGKHFTASTACTPARGVLVTGLYNQQSWMSQTLKGSPNTKVSIPPVLDPVFPTYGKLLRKAGYQTPYIGKWHLSLLQLQHQLEPYGFDGLSKPDPTGANLQGTVGDAADGFMSDKDVSDQAVDWLSQRKAGDQPWCLTVAFQNPHDHEFFWAGTEFQTFNNLFNRQTAYQPFTYYSSNKGTDYPPVVTWSDNTLKSPKSYGYPDIPPNWESADRLKRNKPSTHTFLRAFSELVWGGVTDDPNETKFTVAPFTKVPGIATGVAPFSYWQRSLDSYTQILEVVDQRIGEVVNALPPAVRKNTIVVFTSDHGDYAGAHGFVSNKAASGYEEAVNVPLIVVDPTERFCGDIGTVREELTSSVDILNLLVSLGDGGGQKWQTGPLKKIYGGRHNMIPMLKSADAPGRPYVVLATDELVQSAYNINDAPLHVLGFRTKTEKFMTYSKWRTFSASILPSSLELEFYDYTTAVGRHETHSTPDDPRVKGLLEKLQKEIIPHELRAPLPGLYSFAQHRAQQQYLQFAYLIENPPSGDSKPDVVKDWLGIGLSV